MMRCHQPGCDGEITWDYTCHTWGGNADGTGMMSCLTCDSAIIYECDTCGWNYTDGLNPRNRRSAANEGQRPAWLEEHEMYGPHGIPYVQPGVRSWWEKEDDE